MPLDEIINRLGKAKGAQAVANAVRAELALHQRLIKIGHAEQLKLDHPENTAVVTYSRERIKSASASVALVIEPVRARLSKSVAMSGVASGPRVRASSRPQLDLLVRDNPAYEPSEILKLARERGIKEFDPQTAEELARFDQWVRDRRKAHVKEIAKT